MRTHAPPVTSATPRRSIATIVPGVLLRVVVGLASIGVAAVEERVFGHAVIEEPRGRDPARHGHSHSGRRRRVWRPGSVHRQAGSRGRRLPARRLCRPAATARAGPGLAIGIMLVVVLGPVVLFFAITHRTPPRWVDAAVGVGAEEQLFRSRTLGTCTKRRPIAQRNCAASSSIQQRWCVFREQLIERLTNPLGGRAACR